MPVTPNMERNMVMSHTVTPVMANLVTPYTVTPHGYAGLAKFCYAPRRAMSFSERHSSRTFTNKKDLSAVQAFQNHADTKHEAHIVLCSM